MGWGWGAILLYCTSLGSPDRNFFKLMSQRKRGWEGGGVTAYLNVLCSLQIIMEQLYKINVITAEKNSFEKSTWRGIILK